MPDRREQKSGDGIIPIHRFRVLPNSDWDTIDTRLRPQQHFKYLTHLTESWSLPLCFRSVSPTPVGQSECPTLLAQTARLPV